MKTALINLFFILLVSYSYSQEDSISVNQISFVPGQIAYEDSVLQVPVMEIKIGVPESSTFGKITVDVMDEAGVLLLLKEEYMAEEIASLQQGGLVTIHLKGLIDPAGHYVIKTSFQTPEFYYLPQLINTYPIQ